jgi:CHAD domain-containing protein
MSYKLKAGQGVQKGIRRVIVEEIDEALGELAHPSRLTAVHEARKGVKRIRAALRLARGALGRGTFNRENQAFREVGRHLSEVRDAEVLVQAFEKIKPNVRAIALRRAVTIVGRHVTEKRRATLKTVLGAGQAVDQARTALRMARGRAERWKLRGDEWSALESGFARVYTQGQERFGVAYGDGATSDQFHAWRKRVKDLMFQVRLLRGIWPGVFKAWEKDLDALGDLLGEDHDLAVLQLTIGNDLHDALDPDDQRALRTAIDRRRTRLQTDARPLGLRLYAEPAKGVSDRIGVYWDTWRLAKREEKDQTPPAATKPAPIAR